MFVPLVIGVFGWRGNLHYKWKNDNSYSYSYSFYRKIRNVTSVSGGTLFRRLLFLDWPKRIRYGYSLTKDPYASSIVKSSRIISLYRLFRSAIFCSLIADPTPIYLIKIVKHKIKERRKSHVLQKRYKERILAWTDRHVNMSILDTRDWGPFPLDLPLLGMSNKKSKKWAQNNAWTPDN